MADKNDPIGYAKYVRGLRSTENLLRQFLKTETGLGKNEAYHRGHTYAFEFTKEQQEKVQGLMASGMTFEEAFDYYMRLPEGQR